MLASASLEPYLLPFGDSLGVDGVVCTRLERGRDGLLTGRLEGPNCRGAEKARRLEAWLVDNGLADATLWAYGDSAGDDELLARADRPVRSGRRESGSSRSDDLGLPAPLLAFGTTIRAPARGPEHVLCARSVNETRSGRGRTTDGVEAPARRGRRISGRRQAVLDWDQMVMMPPAGAAVRAERLATLERVAHERFVDGRIGELLDELGELEASLAYDSDDASLIRVTRRDWEKARRIPVALAGEMTKAASEGMEAWVAARAANDYDAFRPWLDRHLELKRAPDRLLRTDRRAVRHPPRRLRARDLDGRGSGRVRQAQRGARAVDRRRREPRTTETTSVPGRSRRTGSVRSASPR